MKLKVVTALVCAFLLIGCASKDDEYLKVLHRENRGTIVYDTRTGVEYWMRNIHSNVLTVLVNENGKPIIYSEVERGSHND